MLRRIVAASAVVLFAVPAARAQDLADICRRVIHPPVGAWSEFRVVGGRGDGATMKMAVVGRESRGDTAYIWLEYVAHGFPIGSEEDGTPDTASFVNKMLVRGYGPGMGEPRARIFKFGDAPAMTMPLDHEQGGAAPGSDALGDCENGTVVGWESVTVPAGTFRALHVRGDSGDGDSWVVPDLPFALVKAGTGGEADDSGLMVLTAHGMGARSVVTETPRPYDPQLLMQMLMRRHGGH